MPKNQTSSKICAKLLRGARPSTNDFAPDNDNAVLYSNPADFFGILRTAVQDLQAKGFSTFKSGSCFSDLTSERTNNSGQYDPEYFIREHAIVVPVLITNDIDGAACETRANKMPMMVNVRKSEGDGVTCGFARKEFVRSCGVI